MTADTIRQSYDGSAAEYARYADVLVYRYLAEPLRHALDTVEGSVLDVCSGTGALGRQLSRAVAVDLSGGQLAHNPLARRVQGDAVRLPFADDAFAAAASAFGISHLRRAEQMIAEMLRVAPLAAVLTWERPTAPFLPKEAVLRVVERHLGARRSPAGERIDRWAAAVGSEPAVRDAFERAGGEAEVRTVRASVPWPGARAFVEYRLSLLGVEARLDDPAAVRREATAEVEALPVEARDWKARLILGVGRRGPSPARPPSPRMPQSLSP